MEEFQCKTTIYSGPGAVSALAGMGGQRLMLVTDPFFMKNGTAQRIAQTAKCAQVEYFDKVQPDPSVELAAEGTARLKEFAPDLLVALGGGSAMDCAKAMAYFAKGNYKLVAIPTTSGSGSEVTDFAILTHNKVKHPLVDKRLRPDAAILDSDLLQELPKGLIAETGFDALSHAVEAYAAKNAGAMTDLYAREAFSSAFAALPASYAGRKDVRLKVHQAATMAGIAFTQAGLGLCHAMAHSLGGLFHVPHGRLNAILLPSVITCNAHVAAKKYAELARAAGIGGSAMENAGTITINGGIKSGTANDATQKAYDSIADIRESMPFGYTVEVDGALENSQKSLKYLLVPVPVMVIIIMTLLMFQLRSPSLMFLALITAPMGLIGVSWGMLLFGKSLGFVADLGILALGGMIIRNSIILLDQIQKHMAAGEDPWHAVIDSAVMRFRPIMLTAAAAILGMIPLMKSVFWGPLAVAIASGLFVATVLTLLVLPTMYAAWFKVKRTS